MKLKGCSVIISVVLTMSSAFSYAPESGVVRLYEYQAENPRRYALFREGQADLDSGWKQTGSVFCAYRNRSSTRNQIYRVKAESPRRYALFEEGRAESNWSRLGSSISAPSESGHNTVQLFEFMAESPRRYAHFSGGRAESGWTSTGKSIYLLNCDGN